MIGEHPAEHPSAAWLAWAVAYAGSHAILTMAFPEAKNMPVECQPIRGRFSALHSGYRWLREFSSALRRHGFHRTLSRLKILRGVNRTTLMTASTCAAQKGLWLFFNPLCPWCLLAGAILMTKIANQTRKHQDSESPASNRYVLDFDPIGAGYTKPNGCLHSIVKLKIAFPRCPASPI